MREKILNLGKLLLLGQLVILLAGCAGLERRASRSAKAPDPSVFDVPEESGELADDKPAAKIQPPKKVGVLLGPGGAKALASAGVLKELQNARIPIVEVVGLEWGALVGGLFAQRGQANDMEWKLYKLEKQEMPSSGFLTSKLKPADIGGLRDYLQDSFNKMEVQRSHISFSCPSQSLSNSHWVWAEAGDMARAVEACLPFPPLYDVRRRRMAGAFAAEEAVGRLRRRGAEVVILINVLNAGTLMDAGQLQDPVGSVILWQEIRRNLRAANAKVNDWIEVDTAKIGLTEFARRKELFAAGETAGKLAAKRLIDKYGF